MAKKTIKLELTQLQAQKMGIVFCTCGHPPNNHFDFKKKPCAHCDCKKYEQVILVPCDEPTCHERRCDEPRKVQN